ncbi:hypothetical protein BDN72DRAFT_766982 [Pluteus cervinus]|uniref:Uncharacterized protein n=1 Tax=Pluteus cervinus TaxID=181527 RepID=A0ACD3AY39_9AGAR|nr:hypothetical protein BDN72DRAFT_766982 [Pluteus cervinus]
MGTFIRFRIDPIATVQEVEDSEVQKAAQEMHCDHYLGYVSQLRTLDHTQPYIAYNIVVLAQGMPERNEEKGIKPDMCVPILPATYHPVGRRPLRPNKVLPFDNCYEHTHLPMITVRAKSEHRDYRDAFRLSIARQVREEELGQKDRSRRRRLVKAIFPKQLGEEGDTESSDGETEESGYDTPINRGSDGGSGEDSSEELGPGDIMAMAFAQGMADNRMLAITDISYDIASFTDYAQPEEFFKEQERLQKWVTFQRYQV